MPHAYKDRDIKRAIKVARDAELPPGWAVEVDPKTGRIRVISGKAAAAEINPWEPALAAIDKS